MSITKKPVSVKIVRNLFNNDLHQQIKALTHEVYEDRHLPFSPLKRDLNIFHRWQANDLPFMRELHYRLTPLMRIHVKAKVKPSYSFLSLYDDDKSICPLHTDRSQCRFTVDYCISQKTPWPIYINSEDMMIEMNEADLSPEEDKRVRDNSKPYLLNENDALIYSGTHYPHFRNQIEKGNHCFLSFFHFVDADFVGSLQ